MPRKRAMWCLLLFLGTVLPAASQAPPAGVADAVTRGMTYANARTLQWKTDKGCATCHHAPMTLWVINAARKRGIPVDEPVGATIRDWLQSSDDAARFFPADTTPPDQRGAPIGAALALAALASAPPEQTDTAFVTRAAAYFAANQEKDGSWILASTKGRPPLFAGPGVTTRLVRIALACFPWSANGDPGEADLAAADDWLARHPPATQQESALDLMLAVRVGRSDEFIRQRADALIALQRDDGGWSQTPGMASDAFATGQALSALGIAARNASIDERVARGIAFLLSTQAEDGSWPMLSRPAQGEDGDPEEGSEPITMAGTTWALLGLVRAGL